MSEEKVGASDPVLEVILLANGVEVARSENSQIWLQALAALKLATLPVINSADAPNTMREETHFPPHQSAESRDAKEPTDLVSKFALELEISPDCLRAAADPSEEAPFIHLDAKYWEAFKRTSGYGRVSPTVLVATLLLLWARQNDAVGEVTTRDCAKVASIIGLSDKNPTRGITNCDWLQLRGKTIRINPREISSAEKVAAAYCTSRGA